ncbi:MAG: molybdopterin cofactor-binding domain-containing protein, partial [Myxococcota bacterium]
RLRRTSPFLRAVLSNRGDVYTALESAKTRVEAEYYVPHLAQSPMEPPAATARWDGDSVELWACTQTPQAAKGTVAAFCDVPKDQVTVNVTWLGGGFGRKSKPDFVAEAAWIARAAKAPVKLFWTREDDLQHGYYHSVSAQRLEGGLDAEGRCVAFLHRTVFPPISSTFSEGDMSPSWGELRLGASDTPFDVKDLRLESGEAPAHIRIGWLRAVSNIYHAFAVQSFAHELAVAADRDPLEVLLELIGPARRFDPNDEGAEYDNYGDPIEEYPIETGRLAAVVRTAAAMARWSSTRPTGHGLGIAVHRSFLSYVATVVEVSVSPNGSLEIPGVWTAMDAGTVVNPDHAVAQAEGGTLYGLSNALYGSITAKDGVVEQRNFPSWRVMRMNESPRQMEVKLIESDAPPGGVGEPPTPPAAPALTNAIFAACGVRVRRLPVFDSSRHDRLTLSRGTGE